jgi:hypothetical protein
MTIKGYIHVIFQKFGCLWLCKIVLPIQVNVAHLLWVLHLRDYFLQQNEDVMQVIPSKVTKSLET